MLWVYPERKTLTLARVELTVVLGHCVTDTCQCTLGHRVCDCRNLTEASLGTVGVDNGGFPCRPAARPPDASGNKDKTAQM